MKSATDTPPTVQLRIEGMHCASCVERVQRALQGVQGVSSASVNLATERASVAFGGDPAALTKAVEQVGYGAEPVADASGGILSAVEGRRQRVAAQKRALIIALVLGLPVIALDFIPHAAWARIVQGTLCFLLLVSAAGRPIVLGGVRAAARLSPDMDTLIALGVLAAIFGGWAGVLLGSHALHHFHAAAMILGFINVGRYLEGRAMHEAGGAIAALARRMPDEAVIRRDGKLQTVKVTELAVGDEVVASTDTTVPVDGVVASGQAALDESAITGESLPRDKAEGDRVLGGSVVREGEITVRATAVGADAAMGRIIRAVEAAQAGKTPMQRLADRVAGVFVPVVVAIGLLTLLGWWIAGEPSRAFVAFIAVVVIACPCAMGLATPTAVLVATGAAALKGILVRDAAALESAAAVKLVLLDKTGTLTTGAPKVTDVVAGTEWNREAVLRMAASAERRSQHPLARAIVTEAERAGLSAEEAAEFSRTAGMGVRAKVDGLAVTVGNEAMLLAEGVDPASISAVVSGVSLGGKSPAFVAIDRTCVGLVALADTLRPEAALAVRRLRELGLEVGMVTGDSVATARAIAEQAGIESVRAETLPEQKLEAVAGQRKPGRRVAFVGDGVNDAPALEAADVGIAFAAGTDVAAAAADLVLVRADLNLVPEAIGLARRSVRIMKQNLFWAAAYNAVAIPLAMSGHVPPGIAAATMMFSSVSVVLNSLRLRRA